MPLPAESVFSDRIRWWNGHLIVQSTKRLACSCRLVWTGRFIDREEAEARLRQAGLQHGAYLVRQKDAITFTVSLVLKVGRFFAQAAVCCALSCR